jgi:hypothetical protein
MVAAVLREGFARLAMEYLAQVAEAAETDGVADFRRRHVGFQ